MSSWDIRLQEELKKTEPLEQVDNDYVNLEQVDNFLNLEQVDNDYGNQEQVDNFVNLEQVDNYLNIQHVDIMHFDNRCRLQVVDICTLSIIVLFGAG